MTLRARHSITCAPVEIRPVSLPTSFFSVYQGSPIPCANVSTPRAQHTLPLAPQQKPAPSLGRVRKHLPGVFRGSQMVEGGLLVHDPETADNQALKDTLGPCTFTCLRHGDDNIGSPRLVRFRDRQKLRTEKSLPGECTRVRAYICCTVLYCVVQAKRLHPRSEPGPCVTAMIQPTSPAHAPAAGRDPLSSFSGCDSIPYRRDGPACARPTEAGHPPPGPFHPPRFRPVNDGGNLDSPAVRVCVLCFPPRPQHICSAPQCTLYYAVRGIHCFVLLYRRDDVGRAEDSPSMPDNASLSGAWSHSGRFCRPSSL